jgi:hypothetical protein
MLQFSRTEQAQSIIQCLGKRSISMHGQCRHQLNIRVVPRQQHGNGIVASGINIQNYFLFH